jgi:hypothetical protein
MAHRPLNVLQVCDHLGWEGSRMHGVKRLFSWMIPRFDASRYAVSLVSLRRKDLSEETLESLGIDISYLSRGKFDPATLPALLKIIDAKQVDVLHLHGYGPPLSVGWQARSAGSRRFLHEHANLTDTPWYQKVADRLLAPYTDIALAVSRSTADFVTGARQIPGDKVKVVYLGVPLEEFSRPGRRTKSPLRARTSVSATASSRSGPSPGCTTRKAIRISWTPPPGWYANDRPRDSFSWARGRCSAPCRRRRTRSTSAIVLCSPGSGATWPRRCRRSI